MAILDENGLSHVWDKIKGNFITLPSKVFNSGERTTSAATCGSFGYRFTRDGVAADMVFYAGTNVSISTGTITGGGSTTSEGIFISARDTTYEIATEEDDGLLPHTSDAVGGSDSDIFMLCIENDLPEWRGWKFESPLSFSVSDNKKTVTLANATTTASGAMSAGDKNKLNAIENGANKTTVDSSLSSTSTNPVQNKVIYSSITTINSTLNNKANIASPTFTGTPKAPTASAGTNTTQLATTAFVQTAVDTAITGTAAFKGVVNSNTEISSLTKFEAGWYWVVGTAGTYVGQTCEVGDTIVAIQSTTSYATSNFNVLQVNMTAMTNAEIDEICTI